MDKADGVERPTPRTYVAGVDGIDGERRRRSLHRGRVAPGADRSRHMLAPIPSMILRTRRVGAIAACLGHIAHAVDKSEFAHQRRPGLRPAAVARCSCRLRHKVGEVDLGRIGSFRIVRLAGHAVDCSVMIRPCRRFRCRVPHRRSIVPDRPAAQPILQVPPRPATTRVPRSCDATASVFAKASIDDSRRFCRPPITSAPRPASIVSRP